MDVTVVVASCGGEEWRQLALNRAIPSIRHLNCEYVGVHVNGGTVAQARNIGLEKVKSEWVCFLDADDELEPGYFEATEQGTADLRAPLVRYVNWGRPQNGRLWEPRVAGHTHHCRDECLQYGNWLVIGTVARTELVRDVGGFREWPVYEDWDLFARCWQAGATVELVKDAVYRAHVRPNSRNRGSMTKRGKHQVHQDIARDLGLVVPA